MLDKSQILVQEHKKGWHPGLWNQDLLKQNSLFYSLDQFISTCVGGERGGERGGARKRLNCLQPFSPFTPMI